MSRPVAERIASALEEAAFIGKNIVDHAVGLSERLRRVEPYLPRRLREYSGEPRAAFLFHGYLQWRPTFNRLVQVLSMKPLGIFPVVCDYQPYSQDLRISAEEQRRVIDWVVAETGVRELSLVGHSQGGIIAREIAQRQAALAGLTRVVTISTPHLGTRAAIAGELNVVATRLLSAVRLIPRIRGESGRQVRVGSPYLAGLNETPLPTGIAFTSIYNRWDPFVWPVHNSRMPYPEATNIALERPGHFHPLYDVATHAVVVNALLPAHARAHGLRSVNVNAG